MLSKNDKDTQCIKTNAPENKTAALRCNSEWKFATKMVNSKSLCPLCGSSYDDDAYVFYMHVAFLYHWDPFTVGLKFKTSELETLKSLFSDSILSELMWLY